jgi:hypothetical protein
MPETFITGSKWADGGFLDEETLDETLTACEKTKDFKYAITVEHLRHVEMGLNALALTILRYSKSEWGNDYYGAVESFRTLANWIDKYHKANNLGRYFKLNPPTS